MSDTIRGIGKVMIFAAGTLIEPFGASTGFEWWALLLGVTALTVGGGMILDLVNP